MELVNLPLEGIRTSGGTQPRVETNESTIAEYAEFIRFGGELPPVIVFDDGAEIWLADGFHRFHAHRKAGAMEIACDVRQGTKRDAILFSVGANASHGLRRSNDDKRKAVMTLLSDSEWSTWSNREIAKACGVSPAFVDNLRASLPTVGSDKPAERTYTTKHGTQAAMNTANIGKATPAQHTPEDASGMAAAPAAQTAPQAAMKRPAPAPEPKELDQLREALAEARDTASLLAEELEACEAIKAGAHFEEIKKLQDRNRILKSQLDDYTTQNQQLKRQVRMLERRAGGQNA